ncbi:MAG: GtrA family protein [Robiginitomaculum sp.]
MSKYFSLKPELPRIIGFFLVGGGGFIIHAGMVFILTSLFSFGDILSWFPAFLLAVTFTWLLNRFLTFRGMGKQTAPQEALRYFSVLAIGAAINFTVYAGVISVEIPVLSTPVIALACGAGIAFFCNYLLLRLLIFNTAKKPNPLKDTSPEDIDNIFYEHAMSIPLARKVTGHARHKMFRHFMAVMQPNENSKILDFGTSEVENDQANMLEKSYKYKHNITCAGLGDGAKILKAYEGINYTPIKPGKALPFTDNSFDIAYSNAVFEHIGSRENQLFILKELSRVAGKVYITTPNRYFPIEHHTAIPLLHFFPSLFRSFTKTGKYEYWSLPQNLQFISLGDLKFIFEKTNLKGKGAHTGINLGLFSSNIAFWTTP